MVCNRWVIKPDDKKAGSPLLPAYTSVTKVKSGFKPLGSAKLSNKD